MTTLTSAPLCVRCCVSPDDLDLLADDWNRLIDEATYPNVFLRWEWVSTWWKWFGNGRRLCVYLVYDGERLVGILPLYAKSRLVDHSERHAVLTPIGVGGPTYPEYLGLIVHRDAVEPVVNQLLTTLSLPAQHWAALELPDVAPDDHGTLALIERFRAKYPCVTQPGERCPVCSLPDSHDALLQRLSGHGRQRERRQLRKAVKECNAQLTSITCEAAAHDFLPSLVELSRCSRTRRGQASPFEQQPYMGFHREVMARMSQSGILKLFVLSFHGRPAAFLYGFLYAGTYYAFQTGFDGEQSRYSPGDVLYQMVIQTLIGDEVKTLDHLRGDEAYKYKFADWERHTTTFCLFRSSGLGYARYWLRYTVARPIYQAAKSTLYRFRDYCLSMHRKSRDRSTD